MRYCTEDVVVEIYWNARIRVWYVTIFSSSEGVLKYDTKYMDAIPELKEVIDFMCSTAVREYRKSKQLEALAKITKEVNIFPRLLSKMRGDSCAKE